MGLLGGKNLRLVKRREDVEGDTSRTQAPALLPHSSARSCSRTEALLPNAKLHLRLPKKTAIHGGIW